MSGPYSLPGRLMRHPSPLSRIVDQKEILALHDRSKCPLHGSPSSARLEEKEGTTELPLLPPSRVPGLQHIQQV